MLTVIYHLLLTLLTIALCLCICLCFCICVCLCIWVFICLYDIIPTRGTRGTRSTPCNTPMYPGMYCIHGTIPKLLLGMFTLRSYPHSLVLVALLFRQHVPMPLVTQDHPSPAIFQRSDPTAPKFLGARVWIRLP